MADKLPNVTPWSKAFGAALREVMKSRGVTQAAVAEKIDRQQSYVSERLAGKRAVDTDVIAGVALVAGVDARTIARETLALMPKPVDLPARRPRSLGKPGALQ